ncbi:helix-turn-helix domain-containing protein, partial [Pseudomonas aeruginosa]|uniref:helix-turn-helix domain-containing protein n=1 Tax=Pseudomonas aeruginosa TaxID=287 RepID=UPI0031B6B656
QGSGGSRIGLPERLGHRFAPTARVTADEGARRHFRQLTGTTVSQWLQAERLALAQRLLETTEHSVQAIAGLAGFGSAVSLRQQFSAAFGLPPLGYRRAFAS